MRRSLGGATLALLVLVTACGGDDSAAPTTTGGSSRCEPDDADPVQLEPLVTAAVPDGFVQQEDDVGNTGPSDLAKAATDDATPGASELFADLRLRRGYSRLWQNAPGEEVIVFLYEFCDDDGARDYLEHATEILTARPEQRPFDAPDLQGELAVSGEKNAFSIATVGATTGPYSVIAVANGKSTLITIPELEQRAAEVATAQVAEL